VLERAFRDTYGHSADMTSSTKEDLAIGTFRRAIGNILPEMTRVASYRAPPGDRFGKLPTSRRASFVITYPAPAIRRKG